MAAAELAAGNLRQLRGQHESLVGGQISRQSAEAPQLLAQDHELLELSPQIDDVDLPLADRVDGERRLERGLHGAAAGERSAAIVDAGEKPLLERVLDVRPAGEPRPLQRPRDELERGLAVTVLEVLGPQAVAV